MSELINRWFSRTARLPGMLACGLRYPNGTVFSRTWELHLPEELLRQIWERLVPIAQFAAADSAETQRWTFDKSIVTAAVRPDGSTLFLLLSNKGGELDAASVERLLNEFRALRS